MKKIVFYELSDSVDKAVIGNVNYQIEDFIDSRNNSRTRTSKYQEFYYDYLPDDLDLMKFRGTKKAKPTDVLNSLWLKTSGLFISAEFMRLLEQFTVENYKYRDVYIKYLSEQKKYYYLDLIGCPAINFKESSFVVQNDITEETIRTIELTSLQDFRNNINKLHDEHGYNVTINPKKLILNKVPDLFKEELTGRILISGTLKNAMKKAGLTGYTTELCNMNFYH